MNQNVFDVMFRVRENNKPPPVPAVAIARALQKIEDTFTLYRVVCALLDY